MRVVEAKQYGGAEVLVLADRPEPAADAGKVRVRIAAATVNPVDLGTRTGLFQSFAPELRPPLVLGWDLAGTVIEDAAGFSAGQPVVGMVPYFPAGVGTYAEIVSADPDWLAPVPAGTDLQRAATLPLNALTARQALEVLNVRSGQTLLVTGASGAVGGYAVQFAAAAGAHVIAVASAGDQDRVRRLGAKDLVARTDDPAALVASVRKIAAEGVDAVLYTVPIGEGLVGAVRDGGAFASVIGGLPAAERDIRLSAVHVVPNATQLAGIVAAYANGELTATPVAEVLPLEQAADAHRRVEAGGFRGKVVLAV
jgi:NADPH:quinone reductase-like Zn-dependent oxidoreductase